MIAWYHQLEDATSAVEVVSIARDYLASWTPHELSKLPQSVRPGKLRDASDIELLHEALIDEFRTSQASGEELARLQELTSFVVRATQRIAELGNAEAAGGTAGGSPATGPMKAARPREG